MVTGSRSIELCNRCIVRIAQSYRLEEGLATYWSLRFRASSLGIGKCERQMSRFSRLVEVRKRHERISFPCVNFSRSESYDIASMGSQAYVKQEWWA